jgi:cellulose synthase/poly-beta-1,6-N-acetylglucosamine synthase-like glycosyltransferase
MTFALLTVAGLLQGLITLLLAIYATSYAILTTFLLIRRRCAERAAPLDEARLPRVTVQVPIYNEVHVIERIIDCVAAFEYPRDRLEIHILDDSTDETSELAAARVALHRERGVDIRVLRRPNREGFKAGALRSGLCEAQGEYIAVFDADFVPQPGFLLKVMPHFATHPRLGLVQTRWAHLNADDSLLTQTQALILDGHFAVEQAVRHRAGLLMTFNGTGGVWRRRCIEESGGWQDDCLSEDLDLSFRAHMCGWEFLFLPEIAVPAEVPPQLAAFKRQQARWAQGAFQVLRKQGWPILASRRLRWHQKAMAFIHLSSHVAHPLMVILLLISPALLFVPRPMRVDLGVLGLAFLGPPLLYVVSQRQLYRGYGRLHALPALVLVGIGIAWSNALGVWRGLTRDGGDFVRTPKFRLEGAAGEWINSGYRLRLDATTWAEALLALYALGVFALACARGEHWMSGFILLCVAAFGAVACLGLLQGRRPSRRLRVAAVPVPDPTPVGGPLSRE